MLRKFLIINALVLATASGLAASDVRRPLEVVPSVDLSRYGGKWYEIARLPNSFQKRCAGDVTATYTLMEDGRIKVVNECKQRNGRTTRAEGVARQADTKGTNSKLEVRFAPWWLGWIPQVWGDYWIIELAADYSYSVVGTPDRKYLWILSRSREMGEDIYRGIVDRIDDKGFESSQLIRTPQSD